MLKSDKVIVVDLEATCWEDQVPDGSFMEIIEIGICNFVVDTGEITDKQSIYVIPEKSNITPYCTALTGITKELITEKGISLKKASEKIIEEYSPYGRVWGSYGEFDRSLLQKQCFNQNIEYPFGLTHINIKSLFALKMKLKNGKGMEKALKIIKEPLEGKHHSGADDAYNTAKLLRHILK
ncbi:MAG TPA: 3'-5' exonuclease [Flavobacterium sp.]|jgi:inhibitor of KinA sporulation pathway (predicted exonuclease)